MGGSRAYVKQVGLLWLVGFREACSFHRVVYFFTSSRPLLIKTGQCFLLNGCIFLGSIFILNSVIIPVLLRILPDHCQKIGSRDLCAIKETLKIYSSVRSILIQLFYVLWFYPLYVFSILLSTIWYNDIAKFAFVAMGRYGATVVKSSSQDESSKTQNVAHMDKPFGFGGIVIGIGEQIYSILLLFVFYIEVSATEWIPYIGKTINFLLLSWLYAYYCFEYKWNLSELGLDKRLNFFESNWAFFAGFGSPCVLAIFFFSRLVSYGIMAILFPLFVLTATGTQEEEVISSQTRSWSGGLGRLPIFYAADTLLKKLLLLFPKAFDKVQREEKVQ
ncbi:etoposide-induced protein [Tasmannia lanceolata]|uniref:etoposide-induced protein n=1 Tax=Tasmannia lanceolata TaxID=3420 RepID=UPI004063CCFA